MLKSEKHDALVDASAKRLEDARSAVAREEMQLHELQGQVVSVKREGRLLLVRQGSGETRTFHLSPHVEIDL